MRRSRSDDGYITLAVLVISGLLAGLVSSLLLVSRPALDLARLGADDAALEALVDGGLTTAGFLLFAAKQTPFDVDGTALRLGRGQVAMAVVDESGRIDLNTSSEDLLAGLFKAVGGKSLEPDIFAARVNDWRDEDSDASVGGAEANDYASAGATYVPRNKPFASTGELRLVLGLSGDDVGRLEPYLTIYNLTGMIDPFSAERPVLLAVPDLPRADVTKFLKARADGAEGRDALRGVVEERSDIFRTEPSGVYRVKVEARLTAGRRGGAEAVVATSSEDGKDFGVVWWSRLPSAPESP